MATDGPICQEKGALHLSSDDEDSKGGGKGGAGSEVEGDEADEDFGFDPDRYVPFTEKCDFSESLRKISKEGLTLIVEYLKEK